MTEFKMYHFQNITIVQERETYFIVRADSDRFGINQIIFEGINYIDCLEYIENHGGLSDIKSVQLIEKEEQKNENEKGNNEMVVLENGVVKYELAVMNDFKEAQEMMDVSHITDIFDAESIYSERAELSQIGTYEVQINRKADHRELLKKMVAESFENDATVFPISYSQWQSGKVLDDSGREVKIGKQLRKKGFSDLLVTYYSQQIKQDKKVFITISGLVQHVTGMSNLAEIGAFDGYGGTSCQDPRHDYEDCNMLGGSIHDDKLFIAMMHYKKDDILDMQDKLIARTILRQIDLDGQNVLVSTNYYGHVPTKNELNEALLKLECVGVFSNNATMSDGINRLEYHEERANGILQYSIYDTVHNYVDDWNTVTFECPTCDGSGMVELWFERSEEEVSCECRACGGSGEREEEIHTYVDEYEEVEVEATIKPYAESYHHKGSYITMMLNKEYMREKLK